MTTPKQCAFDPSLCQNEREVESKFIVSYLLPELGYDPSLWRQELKQGRLRLDFIAYTDQGPKAIPKIVIEAKHPHKHISTGHYQLKNYMLLLQVEYGLLTNGYELVIYQRRNNTKIDKIFDCHINTIADHISSIRSMIGRQKLTVIDTKPVELVIQPERHEMKVLAVFHNKGGVGKTTTVANLADAIARTDKKVLIVDIDSQANATFATGLLNFADGTVDDIKEPSILELLESPRFCPLDEVAKKSSYGTRAIDVVPAHIQLMEKESKLNGLPHIRNVLLRKLQQSNKNYDVVIIDTPPSLNLYAQISLLTASYLLIPSDLKVFANSGLRNVKDLIELTDAFKEMADTPRPKIKVLGILPTKILSNPHYIKNLKTQRIPRIEATYGFTVLQDYMIIERVDVARSFDAHVTVGDMDIPDPQSIFKYNPTSPAVGEFENLATYVLQQMGLPK